MRKLAMSLMASSLLFSFLPLYAEDVEHAGEEPVFVKGAPDGSVKLTGGAVAAGIGYVWGHGELNYDGKSHPFKISGLSIVDVGAASINATGHVYNLKNLADFNGTYTSLSAGLTVAGGGSAAYMKNEHGVILKLESKTAGLRFNLAAGGVTVKMEG